MCVSKLCGDKVYVRNGGRRAGGQAGAGRQERAGRSAQPTTKTPHKDVGNEKNRFQKRAMQFLRKTLCFIFCIQLGSIAKTFLIVSWVILN